MTRVFEFSLIVASIALIAGCSTPSNRHDYARGAQFNPPAKMPAGVKLKNEQNYYPVNHPVDVNAPQPSLVPPDTDFQKYKQTSKVKKTKHVSTAPQPNNKIALARWSESHGKAVLLMSETSKQAWKHVGKALHASNFQVLDQDPSMSSYYILDTGVTGKHITEKTPIYRVYVKSEKENDSMVMLIGENNAPVTASVEKRILGSIEKHLG